MDFTEEPSIPDGGDLEMQIEGVAAHPEENGNLRLLMQTSRGEVRCVLHPCKDQPTGAVYVGGAMGGFEGPSDLYGKLADRLRTQVTGLRLHYRQAGEFEECVLDVLAGVSLLRGLGATGGVALIGHSFGGAAVIKAGELSGQVAGVAALSPQLHGTRSVENLGKPLLLVHGMRDGILDHAASEDIHARAVEPKRLVLYAEADHTLKQNIGDVEELLASWIPEVVGRVPGPSRN